MAGFLFGEKSNSTQIFNEEGKRIPVTLLKSAQCYLTGITWDEAKGVYSVQIAFGPTKTNRKTRAGQLKKAGVNTPLRFLRNVRLDAHKATFTVIEENGKKGLTIGEAKVFIGDEIKPEIVFKKGDIVDVTGTSKGKGFQGVVKRHGFAGGPKTHGQSDRWRAPGSMGQTTTPGRTYKGKRMAGRMGTDTVTVKALQVVDINEKGLYVKGLVPGHIGSYIKVVSTH